MPTLPPTLGATRPKRREPDHRPSPHARGYGATWERLRRMVLRSNPLCAECGALANEVDHVVSRRAGGKDIESNLRALCKSCHSRKTMRVDRWGTYRESE